MRSIFMKPNTALIEVAWPFQGWPFKYTSAIYSKAYHPHLRLFQLSIDDNHLLPNLYEMILMGEYIDQDSDDKLVELSQKLSVERFQKIRTEVLQSSPGRAADVVIHLDDNFKDVIRMATSGKSSRVLIPCVTPVKPFYFEKEKRRKQVENYLHQVCNIAVYGNKTWQQRNLK